MRAYFKSYRVAQRVQVAMRAAGHSCSMMPCNPIQGQPRGWRVSWK